MRFIPDLGGLPGPASPSLDCSLSFNKDQQETVIRADSSWAQVNDLADVE